MKTIKLSFQYMQLNFTKFQNRDHENNRTEKTEMCYVNTYLNHLAIYCIIIRVCPIIIKCFTLFYFQVFA